jgi:hypothetical protein
MKRIWLRPLRRRRYYIYARNGAVFLVGFQNELRVVGPAVAATRGEETALRVLCEQVAGQAFGRMATRNGRLR